MIHVAELDLLDREARLPPTEGELCVLVRAGEEVLGEEWLRAYAPLREPWSCAEIAERYRARVPALARVRPVSEPSPLLTAEITLVVAARDPRRVEGCLESIAALEGTPHEVIVAGFGSRAREVTSVAASAGARTLEAVGPSTAALNAGWRAAGTIVVAFIGQSARPHRGYLGALAHGFALPNIDSVIGQVLAAELDTYPQITFERDLRGLNRGFNRRLHARDVAPFAPHQYIGCSVNLAFRRDALERIGGFDTALGPGTAIGSGEAVDALERLLASGGVILYDPNVLVRHVHPRSRKGLLRFSSDQAAALAMFHCRHGRIGHAVWRGIGPELRNSFRAVRGGQLYHLQLALARIVGAGRGIRNRKRRP